MDNTMAFINMTKLHPGCPPLPLRTLLFLVPRTQDPSEVRARRNVIPAPFTPKHEAADGRKKLSFLQVLLLLIVLILLCGGEKQNPTFDWTGKKKKKERKRVLSVRDTHLNDWFNRLESLGSWLSRAAANLSFGPGKPSRCSSAGWMQEHNEGLGSDESKDPSQPMLLPQEEHPVTAGHLENAHAGKPELPATPRHKGTGHLQ